jgi:hypothetical protein
MAKTEPAKGEQATDAEAERGMLESQLAIAQADVGTAVRALAKVVDQEHVDKRTLDERMAAVQLELEDVPRRGHADVQTRAGGTYSYDYILEADLMKGVRPLLAKHGIATYYRDELLGLEDGMARVRVSLTFAANGEERTVTGDGIGTDVGDKAANKAKTSAVRYLLWKTFLQPSDEDPEQENTTAEQAAHAQRSRSTAASRQPRGRQRPTPEQRRGEMVARINQMAVELDEVQGQPPGRSIGKLLEDVQLQYGEQMGQLPEPDLLAIGKSVSDHLTEQRASAEAGREANDPIPLPPAETDGA